MFAIVFSCGLMAQKLNPTQQKIADIINVAYAQGLQNEGDSVKIDKGFHPAFKMIYKAESNELKELGIKPWRARQVERKANGELPRTKETEVALKFDFIDVTGDFAVAKVKYFEGRKMTYVDYISLYKFEDEWKIITKVFNKVEN